VTNGHVKLTLPDSRVYEGDIKDGLFNGQGVLTYRNGTRYEGVFKNGLPEGQGIYIYANGTRYVGEFKHGDADGPGVYIKPDGTRSEGEFKSQVKPTFVKPTFVRRMSYLMPLLLIASLVLNVVLFVAGGPPRNWYKPSLAKDQASLPPDGVDNMEQFEKIGVLDNETQAEALDVLLAERGIPHEMKSYHDSALDGIYQGTQGWGHVTAPKNRAKEVLQALQDLSGPPNVSGSA
jgi:hypothetical protein